MIKIKGLSKYYNKNKPNEIKALSGIDLELPEKGMVAIFGKSGCGKTTLLNVIGGLDNAQEGTISVNYENINKNTDSIRNKYIGYIFQNFNLNPNESCFENVANALKLCGIRDAETIRIRVLAALKNVGMEKYQKRTPDTLSGGQMQRIAIARAIVKKPKIILADEPTGNLDSENTLLIMDLLKEISRDHLVLIVTHEQNLVDLYCDRVIEINDGKIVGNRENSAANGYLEKPRNHLYLGEFKKTSIVQEYFNVEYYGEHPDEKLNVKIINSDGKLYVKFEKDSNVKILDDASETKLLEGVYIKPENTREANHRKIDMSELQAFEGKSFGKLFSVWDCLVSGWRINFKNNKKKKKMLYFCMWLFAFSLVFTASYFGVSLKNIQDTRDKVSTNAFYVKAIDNETLTSTLFSSIGQNGIKDILLSPEAPIYKQGFVLDNIKFESAPENYNFASGIPVTYLNTNHCESMALVCGRKELKNDNEILISSKLAEKILEDSTVGYITQFKHLLNCKNTEGFKIVGIVESENSEAFFTPLALAKYNYQLNYNYLFQNDLDGKFNIKDGDVLLVHSNNFSNIKTPETIKINGIDFKVAGIVGVESYREWLGYLQGQIIINEEEYYKSLILSENNSISEESDEFSSLLAQYKDKRYFDYLEQYYSHLDKYFEFSKDMNISFYNWLYTYKAQEDAKYLCIDDSLYYYAVKYKTQNTSYPTRSQAMMLYEQSKDL
ncbi:MAG: ABC transporter ATP-binding protein, partial [Clostridia bacterium]|nr:ABC transporter ATP-binding protein [Clostridia bacterium]